MTGEGTRKDTNHQKPPASSRLVELGGFEPPTFCLPDYRMGDPGSALDVQAKGHQSLGPSVRQLSLFDKPRRKSGPRSPEHRAHLSSLQKGIGNSNCKGGIRRKGGYILELCHGHPAADRWGYVYQHRLVMERHLGRLLTQGEIVHHLDGDKANNDLSNLELLRQSDHVRLHEPENHNRYVRAHREAQS